MKEGFFYLYGIIKLESGDIKHSNLHLKHLNSPSMPPPFSVPFF